MHDAIFTRLIAASERSIPISVNEILIHRQACAYFSLVVKSIITSLRAEHTVQPAPSNTNGPVSKLAATMRAAARRSEEPTIYKRSHRFDIRRRFRSITY